MSSRALPTFIAIMVALCLGGCRQTIEIAPRNEALQVKPQQTAWMSHYLLGFVGRETIDVRDYCPGYLVQQIELESTFPTVLLTVSTLGIYAPRHLVVTCQKADEK